jgi:hypothetical protein
MKQEIRNRILSACRRDCNSHYRKLWNERHKWNLEGVRYGRRMDWITVKVALRMYFEGAISKRSLLIQLGDDTRAGKAASKLPDRWHA